MKGDALEIVLEPYDRNIGSNNGFSVFNNDFNFTGFGNSEVYREIFPMGLFPDKISSGMGYGRRFYQCFENMIVRSVGFECKPDLAVSSQNIMRYLGFRSFAIIRLFNSTPKSRNIKWLEKPGFVFAENGWPIGDPSVLAGADAHNFQIQLREPFYLKKDSYVFGEVEHPSRSSIDYFFGYFKIKIIGEEL